MCTQRVEDDVPQVRGLTGLDTVDQLRTHRRCPEFPDVIRNAQKRFLTIWLGGEKVADAVRHVNQMVDVQAFSPSCSAVVDCRTTPCGFA